MSVHIEQPTPYQDVNTALNLMLSNIQVILGDHFVGLYLGGSIALGDFDPQRSDIDFVAVTIEECPPETIIALEEMHARLWATGTKWAMKLDGSYVPQPVLRRWIADSTPCPFVEADRLYCYESGQCGDPAPHRSRTWPSRGGAKPPYLD